MHYQVAIGLGSNVGNRLQAMQQAVQHLSGYVEDIKKSSLYESPALLPQGAPAQWDTPFYNAVIFAQTTLDPHTLLAALQAIEQEMGRVKEGHWSPRVIDLDIIFYADEVMEEPALTLPHAEMAKRDFVLLPLAQLLPNWVHPTLRLTPAQMLEPLATTAQERLTSW